jgi:hypothetical protein
MSSPDLKVDVTPIPDELGRAREPVRLRASVTNLGRDTIDTELYRSTLFIDGEPSFDWGMAIGNGAREPLELELPPGQRVEVDRILSGLVKEPGDHKLVLEVRGVRSQPSTLRVAPNSSA